MSTIEERIENHRRFLQKAEKMFKKYTELRNKWDGNYLFHQQAIINLDKKKKNKESK